MNESIESSDSNHSFSALPLPAAQLDNLARLGFERMTPVQAHSLPSILQGRDVIAQARTGSGKTAAFGIGLLHTLRVREFRIQALVLCPTRELADQVARDIRQLARFQHNVKVLTLCGGVPIGPQIGSLEHGAHIVVGTPGRIQDHLRRATLDLSHVRTLVLDEADRMLDMGFNDAITEVVERLPAQRQTLLFSATYPETIEALSASLQRDPVSIDVEVAHDEPSINQIFFEVQEGRDEALVDLLRHYRPASCVIFCNTKLQCSAVAEALRRQGFKALALHGDLEQRERDEVLVRFANRSVPILIATDVAARGLDIKDLAAVINYELTRDPEVHVHRIGRTGRAGGDGLALSLFTPAEARRVAAIETYQKSPVVLGELAGLRKELRKELRKDLQATSSAGPAAAMATICIDAGRKDKIRPGDILGALTAAGGIAGTAVGKIDLADHQAYVAVAADQVEQALRCLARGKIKGRSVRARRVD